jgi:hypothetical protein
MGVNDYPLIFTTQYRKVQEDRQAFTFLKIL